METPTMHSAPSSPVNLRPLVIIIVVVAIIALVWVGIQHVSKWQTVTVDEHQAILDQVAADSQKVAAGISASDKQAILDSVSKPDKSTSSLTAEQKAAILQSVASGSK